MLLKKRRTERTEEREQKMVFTLFVLSYSFHGNYLRNHKSINLFLMVKIRLTQRTSLANKRTNARTNCCEQQRFFLFLKLFFFSRPVFFSVRLLFCGMSFETRAECEIVRCRTGLIRFVSFWLFVFQLKCRKNEMA